MTYLWRAWCSLQEGPCTTDTALCIPCKTQGSWHCLCICCMQTSCKGRFGFVEQRWAEGHGASREDTASVSICSAQQQVLFILDNLCKNQTWTIYSLKDNSPNEETSLCADKAFWSPVCTQMFILCMEGCGSEAHGPAAVMCSGCYLGWILSHGWLSMWSLGVAFGQWTLRPLQLTVWLLSKVSWLL